MKRIITSILIGSLSLATFAIDGKLERINAIKKSSDFLYGEATMLKQEDAASYAYELLQKEVIGWAEQNGITLQIKSVVDINGLADTLVTRRAEMYRVFAYVKKSDLIQQTDSVVEEKPQPQKIEKPVMKSQDSLVTDSVKQIIHQRFFGKKTRMNDALLRINEAKNFFELKSIMQPLKEKGDILDFGKYATAKHPELCYLIVYDPAGNICALLDKGEDIRKNLKTGKDDSIRNYRGCGAIWFTLPEINDNNKN